MRTQKMLVDGYGKTAKPKTVKPKKTPKPGATTGYMRAYDSISKPQRNAKPSSSRPGAPRRGMR